MNRLVALSVVMGLVGVVGCGDDTGGSGGGTGSGGSSSTDASSTSDASSTTDASSSSTGDAGTCTLEPAIDPDCAEIISGGVTYETGYICTGDAEPDCDNPFSIGGGRYCCPPG